MQAYVPRLQTVGWVCRFLRWQRGFFIPSSATFGKIGQGYAAEVQRFAEVNGIPVRHFAKDEDKRAGHPALHRSCRQPGQGQGRPDRHRAGEGAGVAVVEGQRAGTRRALAPGVAADGVRQPLLLLLVGREVGRAFWKTNAYAPYPIWIWLLCGIPHKTHYVAARWRSASSKDPTPGCSTGPRPVARSSTASSATTWMPAGRIR